jgi:hypothetical protein
MPGFDLEGIIQGAVTGLVGGTSKIIDSINAPKEMKAQIQEQIAALASNHQDALLTAMRDNEKLHADEKKALIADVASARAMNSTIQSTKESSWLSKNIPYCLAIFMTGIWGTCTIYIIFRMLNLVVVDPKVDMTSIMAMYAGITGLYATVLNFYFGSTHNSKDKDATIAAQAATISNS